MLITVKTSFLYAHTQNNSATSHCPSSRQTPLQGTIERAASLLKTHCSTHSRRRTKLVFVAGHDLSFDSKQTVHLVFIKFLFCIKNLPKYFFMERKISWIKQHLFCFIKLFYCDRHFKVMPGCCIHRAYAIKSKINLILLYRYK